MIEIALVVVVVVLAYALLAHKRATARRRLAEIEAGRRCIGCEATDVERDGDQVRCRACGHQTSLGALQRSKLTAAEIETMTSPDGRRNW